MPISNYFSRCYTRFMISTPEIDVQQELSCQQALAHIKKNQFSPYEEDYYVKNVHIKKKYGLLSKHAREYEALSYAQFNCYLECAMNSKSISGQTKCTHKCPNYTFPVRTDINKSIQPLVPPKLIVDSLLKRRI